MVIRKESGYFPFVSDTTEILNSLVLYLSLNKQTNKQENMQREKERSERIKEIKNPYLFIPVSLPRKISFSASLDTPSFLDYLFLFLFFF